MGNLSFGERHIVKGIDPVADAFSGTKYSDVVNIKNWHLARFEIYKGVGATGTSTLTVEACDNASGDNPVAVPFYSQSYAGGDDVPAEVVARTSAGFTTTAGSSQMYAIEVETQKMPVGKTWLRLKAVEVADDPVLGSIRIELLKPRYAAHIPATVIA